MSGNGTIKFYVNNALVGSASFSGQIGKPEAEKSGTSGGSWGEPTVMAMGCNPIGNRADTGWRNGCFTAMNLYNLKIYNQTGCVASYEAKKNVGELKDLTGHNDGNVVAEDWTNEYIQLDGKDDWINLGSMSFRTNQVTLDLTMELVTLPSTYKTLMGNLEGGGVSLGLTEDYKPYMQINIGGSYDNAKATTALKKGQKVHLLGSYDGTTIRLFVDGQLVASKVHAGTLKPATGNTVMSIGSNPSGNSGGGEFTNMKVYSAHIYNKAYWDVSSNGDNSILAWDVNSNSSGAKKVYIASKGNIYANANASYMFSNIGAASICTATTALTNLNLLKTANTTNMYSMFWKTGYNAMTSLDLGTSFSTAKATNLEYMFQECGYKAMTSLNLRGINTSTATSMYAMFDGTGYTAMTSLNLGANFSTANVTKMTRMFKNCGYTKMTTLTLGSKFNTAKVTEMISMFEGTGYKVMTSLNLEGSFDTSKVTNMQAMFKNCGYTAMTTLTLGSKFNTAKVTNMQEMFANTGYTKMTKLDLGDIFYTTVATNMTSMFNATGYTAMGELDLGPAFTRIAATYSNVFTNTGKSGCIIYAPEAIYQNKNAFKLNTSSGTTISYTRGSLNLRYKTEWIVESKNANTSAKNVTIQLRGRTNNNATSVYKSNVTSTLTKDNITVYINGAEASSISKSLGTVTTSKNPTTGYNDVLVTLTLSGFEQSALQSGKNYKEWSGDISIQIAQGTLKDSYGNKNTGLNSSGARVRESLAGPFADFIAPNVAYKFADSNIDKTNKRFTMVFDIVDKYYNASTSKTLAVTDLTIKIDGAVPDWNKVTRNLTSADLSNTVNGASKVVGKRYTLTLSNLQQSTIASGASYKDYSGVITVVVPEKKVYDTSGRYNPTTTITSGVNIPTNSGTGKVVDVVDPFWQVSNVNIDHSKNQVTMTIKGTDKYYSGNSLTKDKITVLVDGETATSVTKTLSSATSITKGVQYTLTLTTWQQSSKQSGKSYLEWSGNTVIRIAAGTLTDSNGNSSKQQDFSIGLVDFIKPTITKVSATKDAANKKETIVFDVDDKYINSTMISADNIKVYMNGVEATSITKSLSRTVKTGTVNKVSKTVGYKYTLVLTNFEQSTYQTNKEYKEWSGTVSIKIVANATKDTSNNGNVDTTITGDFVDFIKPQWRLVGSPTIDHTNNRVVMTIKGTDKYFKATTLATSNIKVYVDGTEVTSVTKSLSTATDVKEGSTKVGVQYTLTLTGWEQSSKQNGKSYFEWSGNTVVKIAAGVLTDTSSNSSPETSFTIGQVDFIKPKIEKVSSSKSGGTETITFRVIDKFFSTSAKLTKDDITVLVDSETASSVSKTLSNPTEIKETVNGASKVIGHQYTMTLTNFEKTRTTIDRNREYSDWSGTVAIKVAAGKVKDTSNNTNAETTITGDFLDVIKPNVTYQFSESNIDKNGKRFTMVFDITDKYYNASTSTTLSVNDLTIKIDGAVPDWNKVTRNLTVADYSNTVYYTSNGVIKHESKVIGKRYTLTLSNLQQSSIAANASYKDYSGVVTVAIPANKVADTTGNKNNAVTITSGVNIPTNSGTGKVVDVVDPFWQVSNVNINHSTNQVTMTIKGTDKYYKASTLSRDNITVLVDGETATSITKTLSPATSISNGVQYTLTLSNWQQSSKQSGKSYLEWSGNTVVKIAAGVLTDTSSNSSPETSFTIGQVDFIKPKIEKVSSSKSGGTETITFRVIDKFFSTSAKLTKDDITVLVDSETASSVSKTLSNPTEIKETVNGASKVIGHQYTMTLTNFEKTRTTIDRNREYSDWSGTVAIKVAAGKVKDTSNNTNAETTITGDFLDVIKPNVTYQFSESNIDKNGKRFTMVFDITDKYYNASTSTTLSVNDLTIKIDGAVPDWNKVTRNLTVADYSNTVYYTSNGVIKHESKVIGKRYTLTLSNLQQSSIAANASYKDYSGVVTVAIPANKVADTTGNKNNAVTITSGVNIPTNSGTGKVVDVVDPFWQVSNVNINHSTNQVTMTIKGTDKYYKASTLSRDNITVLVDGETATSITKTLSPATSISNGVQYTLTLSNWQQSSKQSGKSYLEWSGNTKIRIAAGTMTDTNGNSSKQQDFSIGQVDFIKPMIEKVSSTKGTNNETIVFDVNDKYISTKLSAANITTLINGEVADVKTTITSISDIKGTGKFSAKTVGHRYTVVVSNFNKGRKNGRKYSDWSGTVSLRIAADAVQDTSQNKNNATTITGDFVDFIKPEFTYVYSSGNIDHTNKTLTVDFTVADRYFSTSTLTSNAANVAVKLIDKNINISGLTKTITKLSDYSDGSRGKVGENYRLTIGNIQRTTETDGLRDYSGPMSITFPANMVKDTSGNANDAKTITIGVNDPGTGSQQVVDVVSPVWSVASADVNTGIVKIRVKDKYLLKTGTANTALQLTTSEIAVLVNGTESTQVTKTITSGPTLVASGSNGYDTTYEYTIKIGNIAQTTTNYIEFTPKETVVGGKAKYRDENGGSITLRIKAGAVQDAFKNTNAQQDLYVGNVDNTGPEVYDIQKTIAANGDETFVFNITDKNYDSSKVVALNELNITIDGAQFSSAVQKNLTSQTLTDSATNKVLGHQYTLKLTNMKESTSSFASAVTATTNRRVYREYSGTIRIVINSNAARDLKGNTLNTATTTITSFNDKLAPEVVYIWSNSVINKNSKTFTMIFDITDKYYSSASLAIGDLTIKIGGKTPNWSSNEVGRSLSVSDIPNAAGKGKRYTLTLSNLQKLQIKSGDKYLDYSGVVTVAIPANKVKDTSGQGNVATTLTSGITIPGGTGSQEVVDVVEPYVQKMSSTVNAPAKTASITVRISDRYFNKSTLTKDTIKVYINGTENASVKTGWSTSEETESRTEKGTTSTVHVATNYTLNISGFDSNINQIKVVVPANVVKDTSENGNKQTEYIIYNVLRSAANEYDKEKESAFLGNDKMQRQNVDNVTFVNNIPSTIYDKSNKKILNTSTTWDVSAQQDKSILAWYTTSNGAYKVYIGSDSEMFGNVDSSHLFYFVGFSDKCTSKETIKNLNLLNVSNVTNMRGMFWMTGWRSMTKLDLGSNFDTSNVTDMVCMFGETGSQAMTTLNLGSKFNTSKVTDMNFMFSQTGYVKLTALNLGSLFDTSNVTNMNNMFSATGYKAMTSLNLGSKFNTAKVTDMTGMFLSCGYTAMTSLNLGSNFDTSKVTSMTSMFQECGYTAMKSLTLGSKFNTANVTTMEAMFYQTGKMAMTSLNLGSQFNTSKVTNMGYMFRECGFSSMTSFSLGSLFDTSNVTDMNNMFYQFGCDNLQSLNLGDKFNTSKVTNMHNMFAGVGQNSSMTTLDLGDKFYTTNATDMIYMFHATGQRSMTTIDLGPAFTKIADSHDNMFNDSTGKSGCVIYAPESIFQDKNNFKLNTSATAGTINYTRGTINPKYRTEWIKESVTVDESNKKVMITLRGRTNSEAGTTYVSNLTSSLAAGNIRVYINGTEITNIGKSLGTATTVQNATTKANDVRQVLTLTNIEQGRVTGKEYKEYSGNISLEIAQGNLTDKYGNKNMAVTSAGVRTGNTVADTTVQKNTSNTMFADFTKPEFTYVYADSDINHTNKTLTAIFKVADKYRASTAFTKKSDGTYDASSITVGIDSYDKTALNNAISKKLTLEGETTEEISGQNRVTVQTYKLVIGNLEQKGQGGLSDGYTYSGILTLGFPEGTITDTSGHKSPATTITIGKNEPGGTGTGKPVDVVDPVWSVASANADTGVVKLRVKDKYLTKSTSKFNLAKESIKIIVNGVESTAILKTLDGPTTITDGQEYEYTLTLSNIAPSGGGYTEFTPLETIVGGTAKYRNDNGGSITIRIPAGAVTDANGNKTKQQDLNVGNMDLTEPEVYFVQKNRDLANNQETIIFNVTDKNYDSTKLIAANELTTWVDGTQMDSKLTKTISSKTISTTIDGATRVVGHQYTLVLKGFAESDSAFASSGRVYREYSGNLQVKINKDAARDKRGNTLNSSTTTIAQFTDVVRPDIKAKWSDAVINKNNKTFTMIFDITDKYYASSSLAIGDLTIKIGGKTPDWSSNEVGRSLSVSDIPGAAGKGKRYTLTLSNLQALQIKSGDKYLDYSGVVTVAIPANKVKDTTGNTNLAKTITSGITIPGGTGSEQEVDVVEPYVQKMSSTVNAVAKTASITVRISDRYFNKSTLTKDTIKVYINGTENASVKTGWSTSEETESRTEKGTTSTVHVATNYTLNISGFDSNINQIKVVVPANVVKDTSENGNKQTEYIIYNVLRKQDDRDEDDTAPFLGNATVPRKDIDNVTFVSSTAGKNSTKWDVSAQGDSSILAWYTKNSNGTFKVYVGSDYEIFGNTDSSYLFRSVGLSDYCTSTETITNIDLLNVSSVTNMRRMFELTGTKAMTKLDLGNNFNTINVTNMAAMFSGTGQKAMTTLNLGSNFNTSRVTNMRWMFNYTGRDKMTSLNLGNNFDTSNAQYMEHMFSYTGYYSMTTLNLGSKFNTSKVKYMEYMFCGCGYNALTSLDLGSNFDTSSVTNMESMFCATGFSKLTNLDLGSKFNTIKVTNMLKMFYMTGHDTLTELDLGDKFNTSKVTNMAYMFTWIGRLKTLNLGDNFDTSNVTDMNGMFWGTGYFQMTNFSLGNKFNTKNVQDMSYMFYDFANNITSLDLGDQFYTTNATNMIFMFFNCGAGKMTSLDLGPAFTKIPDGTAMNYDHAETLEAYYQMFEGAGKSGCVIHAPESIFQDKNNFKLNASATTGTVNYTKGTINPKYRTEWKKEKVVLDQANDNIKITLRGTTNTSVAENEYISDVTSSLALNKIKVLIDGTDITSTVLNAQGIGNATQTTENSRTGAKDVLQTITLTNFAKAAKRLNGKKYKEWSGNITIEIAQGTLSEKYGNKNMLVATDGTRTVSTVKETNKVSKNTANTMFTDYIKPEFTYSSITDTNIVHGTGRKVEVMFDVTDKYFESTTLSNLNASQITIGMDDYDETELNKAITKKLEKVGTITDTVNGVSNVTVGERYKLTITGLEQQNEKGLSDGYTYSGYMSLKFAKGTIKDKSGNLSDATTITIGKNEPGGSDTDKTVVDIVDPVWTLGDVDTNDGTIKLRVKDKFLIKDKSKFELTTGKITIYADDVISTEIEKQISGPVEIRANEEYEYTLTLLNIKPDRDEYEEFTPKNPIVGGTAKYKKENGGDIKIKIAAGAVTDAYGNKTKEQIIDPGKIDGTGPEVYDIQKTKDATNNKETFVFNVTDKNYDSTDLVTIDELTVWLDGKQVDIDGEITKKFITNPVAKIGTPVEIITTVNGQERVVGHQYTLEIGSIVETNAEFVASNRKYRELSGTLEIKIATDAAKDKKGNKINPDTATITDFNDMIKPEVIYKYATSNIDKTNKIFKMEFDLVDKYCKTINNIAVTDLTIQIDGKVPDWTKVTRNLEVSDIKEPVNGTNKLIGRHYTLTLSNLEQLQVKSGDNYLDYSGVITVAIPANKMQDTTGNQNVTTTITSGVSIPAGTGSDTIVDVVDPLIEKISSTVDAPTKTATLNFKVTDKYFASSDLANGNIEILVNGAKNTTVAANNALTVVKNLTEPRTVDGKTVQVQYGIEYSLKISGFDANANQIKVRFPANLVKDKAVEGKQNGNKQTDIVVYNVLRSAAAEADSTNESVNSSIFLGNSAVLRKNIDNVTFVSGISGKNNTAWDVSAQGDGSILAWYTKNSNGSFKVYIGSNYEIFANTNSTNLFHYVGESTLCTSAETITNLNLLNVSSVTNMKYMFRHTGMNAMTKLDLGSNFNTQNVTNMQTMFGETGYNSMTTINLGNNFDTSKVIDMQWMFCNTGNKKMTSLNLGSKFNTSNVYEMNNMFNGCGYTAMTTLNLGSQFNTGKVTNMASMFVYCGYNSLTSLDLGSLFDTSKVTNMSYMFAYAGYTAMTNLNLGANFDTSKVTNMSNMFKATGYTKMASLDLKTKFNTSKVTNMSGMFASTGHELMTTLDLGANFNTSAVTDMSSMFEATGYKKMTTLNLREKFNTSKVTNMSKMFKNVGFTAMTSLDLGNTFYTTVATDTSEMFNNTGATAMTILDLGPAFDRIPDTNTDMFKNTGTAALVVYAPESIYSNVTTFIANRTRN